jgi:hypothetical protein
MLTNLIKLPVRRSTCQNVLFQTRMYSPLISSAAAVQQREECIEEIIEANLAHGKVTLWTRVDANEK